MKRDALPADGTIDFDGGGSSTPHARGSLPRFFRWFTEGCVLRQIEATDAARIWKSALHPGFALCFTDAPPSSLQELETLVHRAQADWMHGRSYTLAVQKKGTQELVGTLGLTATASEGDWAIDWFVHPRFVAAEEAREMLHAACTILFRTLGAVTAGVRCPPARPHFQRMLQRTGFTPASAAAPTAPQWHAIDAVQWAALAAPHGVETAHWAPTAPRLDLQLL